MNASKHEQGPLARFLGLEVKGVKKGKRKAYRAHGKNSAYGVHHIKFCHELTGRCEQSIENFKQKFCQMLPLVQRPASIHDRICRAQAEGSCYEGNLLLNCTTYQTIRSINSSAESSVNPHPL